MKMLFKMLLLTVVVATIAGCCIWREIGKGPTKEEETGFAKLPYYKDGQFQTPEPVVANTGKVRNGPAGWSRFLTRSPFAPKEKLPKVMLDKTSFADIPENFSIYWLGHSSAILEVDGKRMIFDPVFDNAAPIPVAVSRYDESPLARDQLPGLDYIVITHNHYDHLERKSVVAIKEGTFIVPLGIKTMLKGWGIAEERVVELGWGDSFKDEGFEIVAEEGMHYTRRSKSDRNKTLWNSYVIKTPSKNIFWGGDTGYGKHFAKIGKKYGVFDFAALEIDGWNPGWPSIHMFPHEVAMAAKDINAKVLLPIHWAVFDLALHPWHESIDMVLEEFAGSDIKIVTPKMGEKIGLNSTTSYWWKDEE